MNYGKENLRGFHCLDLMRNNESREGMRRKRKEKENYTLGYLWISDGHGMDSLMNIDYDKINRYFKYLLVDFFDKKYLLVDEYGA